MIVSFLIAPRLSRAIAVILSNKIASRRWFLGALAPAHYTVQSHPVQPLDRIK